MNLTFIRPEPYNNEYGLVVCEVSAFCFGYNTIIGYIIKADNGYNRVWLFE